MGQGLGYVVQGCREGGRIGVRVFKRQNNVSNDFME